MERHEAHVEDDVLYLETEGEPMEIGPVDDLVDLLGGPEYVLEYDEKQRKVSWLQTDDEGKIRLDTRSEMIDFPYPPDMVEALANTPLESIEGEDYTKRASLFADLLSNIWDSKGNPGQVED